MKLTAITCVQQRFNTTAVAITLVEETLARCFLPRPAARTRGTWPRTPTLHCFGGILGAHAHDTHADSSYFVIRQPSIFSARQHTHTHTHVSLLTHEIEACRYDIMHSLAVLPETSKFDARASGTFLLSSFYNRLANPRGSAQKSSYIYTYDMTRRPCTNAWCTLGEAPVLSYRWEFPNFREKPPQSALQILPQDVVQTIGAVVPPYIQYHTYRAYDIMQNSGIN